MESIGNSAESQPIIDSTDNKQFETELAQQKIQSLDERSLKQLDFALTEMFNFYIRKNSDKANDFEDMQLKKLSLRGYVAFVRDMQIPIDIQRLTEIWKKSSTDKLSLTYDDFKSSMGKLANASNLYLIDQTKRKLQQAKQNSKKLSQSNNGLATDQFDISSLRAELFQLKSQSGEQWQIQFLQKYIPYNQPQKYRQKMTNYLDELNLVTTNTKQARMMVAQQNNTIIQPEIRQSRLQQLESVDRLNQKLSQKPKDKSLDLSQDKDRFKLQLKKRDKPMSERVQNPNLKQTSPTNTNILQVVNPNSNNYKDISADITILEEKSPKERRKLTFEDINKMHFKDLASTFEEVYDPSSLIGLEQEQLQKKSYKEDILARLYTKPIVTDQTPKIQVLMSLDDYNPINEARVNFQTDQANRGQNGLKEAVNVSKSTPIFTYNQQNQQKPPMIVKEYQDQPEFRQGGRRKYLNSQKKEAKSGERAVAPRFSDKVSEIMDSGDSTAKTTTRKNTRKSYDNYLDTLSLFKKKLEKEAAQKEKDYQQVNILKTPVGNLRSLPKIPVVQKKEQVDDAVSRVAKLEQLQLELKKQQFENILKSQDAKQNKQLKAVTLMQSRAK